MSLLLDLLEKFERCAGLKINNTNSDAINVAGKMEKQISRSTLSGLKTCLCLRDTLLKLEKNSDKLNFFKVF